VAWLEVADDGEGIPEEDVVSVFQPYQRSHNAEGQPLSVGLGLTVSLKLARLMGGTLDYRNVEGWSVFRLELPIAGSIHSVPAIAEGGVASG
jgi:signal transduction histidine kinase